MILGGEPGQVFELSDRKPQRRWAGGGFLPRAGSPAWHERPLLGARRLRSTSSLAIDTLPGPSQVADALAMPAADESRPPARAREKNPLALRWEDGGGKAPDTRAKTTAPH